MPNNEMKSNINISSNVYIRTESAEYQDVAFIEQITGYNALLKMSTRAKNASVQIDLTYAQEQELKNSIPCTSFNNLLDEQTFGVVKIDNEIVWSCRCENVDCANYEDCMALPNSKRIDRNYLNLDGIFDEKINEDKLDDSIFIDKNIVTGDQQLPTTEVFQFDDTAFNYTKINDITKIIQATIDDNIIVNASSGMGKTYATIKRVEYVLENKLIANPEEVLVLCFTKSTQSYIKSNVPENVLVSTLDSFATKCLFELEDNKYLSLTYDERIERLNCQISQVDLSKYKLVIFDELNDFQNQRAMMALNILRKVSCGVLLLGDKCQALPEENRIKSPVNIDVVRLYNMLNKIMPREAKKYELITNYKEHEETQLSKMAKNIRSGLLYKSLTDAKKVIKKEFEVIETEKTVIEKIKPVVKSCETLAFLCKNDSEAEYVSSVLYKSKVPHNLIRNMPNKYSYNRWIADLLWDHCSDVITRQDFTERYIARLSTDEILANKMYDLLQEFALEYNDTKQSDDILKSDLLMKFVNGKEPEVEFTNKNDRQITVCTIAKSKGEYFDNVYLVNFDIDNLSDDSVKLDKLHEIYVSIIRAKKSVKLINFKNEIAFKKTEKYRSYRTYKKYNDEYCSHFSVGDDIAMQCFILGSFKDVLFGQRYLSESVRVNDKVELILQDDTYHIYHVKNTRTSQKVTQYIGIISDEMFDDFKNSMSVYNDGILPQRLYDLYISQVVTVPQNVNSKDVSVQFKKSKFTIGVEISGFAKIDWNG